MPDAHARKRSRRPTIVDGSKNGRKSGRAHDGLVTDLGVAVDRANADDFGGGGKSKSSLKIGRMRQDTLNTCYVMRYKWFVTVI